MFKKQQPVLPVGRSSVWDIMGTLEQDTYTILIKSVSNLSAGDIRAIGRAGLGKNQVDAQASIFKEVNSCFPSLGAKSVGVTLSLYNHLVAMGHYKQS